MACSPQWLLARVLRFLKDLWTEGAGQLWVGQTVRLGTYTHCPLCGDMLVPQNSRTSELEESPGNTPEAWHCRDSHTLQNARAQLPQLRGSPTQGVWGRKVQALADIKHF